MFVNHLLSVLDSKPPVVVGIDPDPKKIRSLCPGWSEEFLSGQDISDRSALASLCREYSFAIIDAVYDLVPAVKLQSAFFEVWGYHGIKVMEEVNGYARRHGLLVIADIKRGDVPSTSEYYAAAYLGRNRDIPSMMTFDAVTVNPYLGLDSLGPFINYTRPPVSAGSFILIKTSNPGSGDIQDLLVGGEPIYEYLAKLLAEVIGKKAVGEYVNLGAVVGATYPEAAQRIRNILPYSFLLVPGLGAQGGDFSHIRKYLNSDGKGALFNFSRSIIYPPSGFDQNGGASLGDALRHAIRKAALWCIAEVKSSL